MAAPPVAGWERAVLAGLGAPATTENLRFLDAWVRAEGGRASNNPFNTTQPAAGASAYNGVGVRNYVSPQQGINATLQTLQNGRYGDILTALRRGSSAVADAQALASSPWGTGAGVLRVLGAGGGGQSSGQVTLNPAFPPALQALRNAGYDVRVTSGIRTRAEQSNLYARYVNSGYDIRYIAAKPGTSRHEFGDAEDVLVNGKPIGQVPGALAIVRPYGLTTPVKGDPVHLQASARSVASARTGGAAAAGAAGASGLDKTTLALMLLSRTPFQPPPVAQIGTAAAPLVHVEDPAGVQADADATLHRAADYLAAVKGAFTNPGFAQHLYPGLPATTLGQAASGVHAPTPGAGDLVFFGRGAPTHQGLVLGGNQFLHGTDGGRVLRISSLAHSPYQSSLVGSRSVR